MATGITNRFAPFRPLLGGIAIQNRNVGRLGTLGCIATSDGSDRWIVSCYHVLCRIDSEYPAGTTEPIFQPFFEISQTPIAEIDGSKVDRSLDIAAAKVTGAWAIGRVLGMGRLTPPSLPIVGMRVLKAGITTGVTEGVISNFNTDEIEISVPVGVQSTYELSEEGDSGSLWIDAATMSPIGLHYQGSTGNKELAFARPLPLVLARLDLRMVIE